MNNQPCTLDCSTCEHNQLVPHTDYAGIRGYACMKCHELHPAEVVEVKKPSHLHLVSWESEVGK